MRLRRRPEPHDRTALGHPLDDVLPGEARVLLAAQESLDGTRSGMSRSIRRK